MKKNIKKIPLSKLKLDLENPRYNKVAGPFSNENEVISYMMDFEQLPALIQSISNTGYENDEAPAKHPLSMKLIIKSMIRNVKLVFQRF